MHPSTSAFGWGSGTISKARNISWVMHDQFLTTAPVIDLEVQGRKGKIIADLHAYKIFFRDPPSLNGFTQGWNQRYVTSFVKPVRFYVRGFEFTRQLDYFIECIIQGKPNKMCSFEDGLAVDKVISQIRMNAK